MMGLMRKTGLLQAAAVLLAAAAPAVGQNKGQWTTTAKPATDIVRAEQQRLLMVRAQEPKVDIDTKSAVPLEEILEQFRLQGKLSIDLSPANIPPGEKMYFRGGPDAFSVVLEMFLKKGDLFIVEEAPNFIRLARPTRVTYSFSKANIRSVIEIIAKEAGANIIISPEIDGEITLTVKDVPWFEVLEDIVKTLKFVVVKENYNILRVIPRADLNEQMETRVFTLQYLQTTPAYRATIKGNNQLALGKAVSGGAGGAGGAAAVGGGGGLTAQAFPLMDIVKAAMTQSGGKPLGNVQYDEEHNALVVTDTIPVLDKVTELIQRLDYEPEQVIVEARFLSTRNTDLFHWGLTWSNPNVALGTQPSFGMTSDLASPFLGGQAAVAGVITTPVEIPTASTSSGPFGLGSGLRGNWLNAYDIDVVMRMYREDRYSKFLQEPTLAVVDGQPATIFVGREIHYAEEVISSTGTGANTQPTVSLKEAANSPVNEGFTLFMIPKIVRNQNKVMMTIIPQFDRLSGTSSVVNSGFNTFTTQAGAISRSIDLPEITKSTLVTRLVMQNGTTVILGGLNQATDTMVERKIPFLGDIPVLGWLFKGSQQAQISDHLMIVLTPNIVQPTDRANEYLRLAFAHRGLANKDEYEQVKSPQPIEQWRLKQAEAQKALIEEAKKLKENGGAAPKPENGGAKPK